MKYLSECDLIVYDLHSGKPDDVRLALDALNKHKTEEEKVLILISSLMAWQGTPRKQEEIKTAEQLAAEAAAAQAEVPEEEKAAEEAPSEKQDSEYKDSQEEEEEAVEEVPEEEEVPEKIRKRYKHLAFTELDFKMRNPIEEYKIVK